MAELPSDLPLQQPIGLIRLDDVRCFVAVAHLGSMSLAAAQIGVSQPNISKTLKRMETELGIPLFDRTQRKIVLTVCGQLLYQKGITMLREHYSAMEIINVDNVCIKGLLTVAIPPWALTALGAKLFKRFIQEHPQLKLQFVFPSAHRRIDGMDIDLLIDLHPPVSRNLHQVPIRQLTSYAYATDEYLNCSSPLTCLADIENHLCVGLDIKSSFAAGEGHWPYIDENSQLKRLSVKKITLAESLDYCFDLAMAGLGLALLPEIYVNQRDTSRKLRKALPAEKGIPQPLYALFPHHNVMPPKLKLLLEAIGEQQ